MPHDAKVCCHLLPCRLCQTALLLTAGIKSARALPHLTSERLRIVGHHLPGKAGQLLAHLIQTRVRLHLALQVQ